MSHGGEAAAGSGSLFYYDTDGTAQEVVIGSLGQVLKISIDLIPKWETESAATTGLGIPDVSLVQSVPVFDVTTGDSITGTQVLIGGSGHMADVKTATFEEEFKKGIAGANYQLNWNQGQKQSARLTAATTVTFIDPSGAGNFLLRLIQDGTGGRVPTWPASVRWSAGTAPDFSASSGNQQDIVSFYYSGAEYYGVASLDFF